MRLSGLASGMDTDTMVQQMMKIERMKVDRVEQNKQTILWRQEQYNSVNKTLANFILNTQKDIGLRKTTSTGTMFGSSYKNLDYVKKAESSDESKATVTTTGKVVNGEFSLEIKEVATNSSLNSNKVIGENDNFGDKLSFTLKTGKTYKHKNIDENGIITYEDKAIEKEIIVNKSAGSDGITMKDIAREINSAKVWIVDGEQISDDEYKDRIEANPKLVKDSNHVSLGLTAIYLSDSEGGSLSLQTTETGEQAKIELTGTGDGKDTIEDIFKDELGTPEAEMRTATKATNSIIKFNGVELKYNSNNITLNGLNIELKAKTEGPERVTINASTNTQGIMEKIEKLVADYNELVDTVSGLVSEKRYSSYKPLSSEERKAMNEDDLKLWDEKAKSGLLNRDSTLERTLQSMRTDLYKTVEGASGSFKHITEIGISTEKYSQGSAGGKLTIDTDKLRKAIEQDADSVMELLFKEPTEMLERPTLPVKEETENDETFKGRMADYQTKLSEYQIKNKVHMNEHSGIFTRVYEGLTDSMKAIIDKSGPGQDQALYRGIKSNMLIDFVTKKGSISDLDKSVLDMNKQIDSLNILLGRKEDAHYAKFAAMEKQMYQMQNQSGWLAQQFQY